MEGCAEWPDIIPSLLDTTLDLGHVLVGTGQVEHRSTWNGLKQRLQGREFAVGVHRCDVRTTLEIILINPLNALNIFSAVQSAR
jgi:hypothetical protein